MAETAEAYKEHGGIDMDTITRVRRQELLEIAEANTRERMKPVADVMKEIMRLKDKAAQISVQESADILDVDAAYQAWANWAWGVQKQIRADEFQGEIEWWR